MDLIDLSISLTKIFLITFVALLPMIAYSVYAERRISAVIQDRLGPNRVGPYGLLQPMADGIKFLLKEDFTPDHVNKVFYFLAPALVMVPALVTLAAVPFGGYLNLDPILQPLFGVSKGPIPMVIADINVGIVFVFAISSLAVYGIFLAGWSSNSKYPFLGGVRSSSQMISYELAIGVAVVPVLMITEELRFSGIIEFQREHGWLLFLPFTGSTGDMSLLYKLALWIPLVISFIIFTTCIFAETNRAPFDLPECEQELVAGYHTEYSSMKFALFFLGEYAAMIVGSGVVVTLFLGGWSTFPWGDGSENMFIGLLNILMFFAKVIAFILFFIWVRWTVPRFRFDQLMNLSWVWFFEIATANVIIVAILMALRPFFG